MTLILHPSVDWSPHQTRGDSRLRRDRVDTSGKITLRYQGGLYSIGIGRTHARTHVLVLQN